MKNTELSIVNQKINIFFLPAQAIAIALAMLMLIAFGRAIC
jgi:hypothetical protein